MTPSTLHARLLAFSAQWEREGNAPETVAILREAAAALSGREAVGAVAFDISKWFNKWRASLPECAIAESYSLHNRLNNAVFPAAPSAKWGCPMATPNERDRFEAWAKDTMSLVKEPGGYKEATTHHAWRAWQAALTREQREGECPVCGLAWGEHRLGYAASSCKAKPQPEAPGAVAGWSEAEQRATLVNSLRASKSWMTGYAEAFVDAFQDHARTTPPAPVDVRVVEDPSGFSAEMVLDEANNWTARYTGAEMLRNYAALLDGQPAGVVIDDAMVRRAVHAYDEWMIEHAPDETDAYHDGMRAALTAALGGGGRP